ncbi:hypothetical protein [Aeoliella sp. SH292]|uniref:hypothetical protein n=1 Tax=Aeoliella sp. SH292 TaxID=3454464 RepID=UPI003F96B03B
MRLVTSFTCLAVVSLATLARGEEPHFTGEIYATGGGDAPQFLVESGAKPTGDGQIYFERYTDPAGNLIGEIQATYEAGRLKAVKFEQHQLGETSSAVIADGKVHYSHTSGGKTKESTEKDPGNLVAFPALPYVIASNWDTLHQGKTIDFTIPAPARRQGIAFQITKDKSWSQAGRAVTQFKMVPANPLLRTLAEPKYFVFADDSKQLIEARGRTLLKTGGPGNWKDFDGRVVYRPAAK